LKINQIILQVAVLIRSAPWTCGRWCISWFHDEEEIRSASWPFTFSDYYLDMVWLCSRWSPISGMIYLWIQIFVKIWRLPCGI
jgi:hypothetical protein